MATKENITTSETGSAQADQAPSIRPIVEGISTTESLASLAARWGSRAATWDQQIKRSDHYTAATYARFNKFAGDVFGSLAQAGTGIDIGCGTAEATRPLAGKVSRLYLLDIAPEMLAIAAGKYPDAVTLPASATSIPLPDSSVDYAISRGIVVSHVGSELSGTFLDEMSRIVRPGGVVLFDFLNDQTVNPSAVSAPKATFTVEQMRAQLEARGYTHIVFDGDNNTREVRVCAIRG